MIETTTIPTFRFDVALSFPGEHRERVSRIANLLADRVGGRERVLYDIWHRAEFARPNLDIYLPDLYQEKSRLLVFFLCKEYSEKEWCGLEWRAGRDLIKRGEDARIMFLRFDHADIPGLRSIDGYLNITEMDDADVSNDILERLSKLLPTSDPKALNDIVADLRRRTLPDILLRCGKIKILNMEQPIDLAGIYTNVNILEKRTANRRQTIEELLETASVEQVDRFGIPAVEVRRVPGLAVLDRHRRVILYGKPGAGKTTFLKRIATECAYGRYRGTLVPAFVTLRDFADSRARGLFSFLLRQWGEDQAAATLVMRQGRALVLLDGLDEVRDTNFARVRNAVETFVTDFPQCSVALTCRIAAREHTFEHFVEVEIADFSEPQIESFARGWFHVHSESRKARSFMRKLKQNRRLYELASNPLLLTLLCLVFGERGEFDGSRAELYRHGIEVLLRKWDAKRGIERDRPYDLKVGDFEALLEDIAYQRFLKSEYFFDQRTLERQIDQYLRDRELVRTEGAQAEVVLKAVEAQLGILVERAARVYSFSHLTFQEYLTAQRVAKKPTLLSTIGARVGERRWREVWLLLAGMLDGDDLILEMKSAVDGMVSQSHPIQQLLDWNFRHGALQQRRTKPAALRAIYLELALVRYVADRRFNEGLPLALGLVNSVRRAHDVSLEISKASMLARDVDRALDLDLNLDPSLALAHAAAVARTAEESAVCDRGLAEDIERLSLDLPSLCTSASQRLGGKELIRKLKALGLRYLNSIPDRLTLTKEEVLMIALYRDANELLVECMNSSRDLTTRTRRYIEDTMLLPLDKIRQLPPDLG